MTGNSLAAQWLGLHAFPDEGMGLMADRGTKTLQASVRPPPQKKKDDKSGQGATPSVPWRKETLPDRDSPALWVFPCTTLYGFLPL